MLGQTRLYLVEMSSWNLPVVEESTQNNRNKRQVTSSESCQWSLSEKWLWGLDFTLNTTVLPAVPAVWVSVPHPFCTLNLLADRWLQETAISATMALFFLGNLANQKHPPPCGRAAIKDNVQHNIWIYLYMDGFIYERDGSVLWHQHVTFLSDAQQHIRRKCTIMGRGESRRERCLWEIPEWGAIYSLTDEAGWGEWATLECISVCMSVCVCVKGGQRCRERRGKVAGMWVYRHVCMWELWKCVKTMRRDSCPEVSRSTGGCVPQCSSSSSSRGKRDRGEAEREDRKNCRRFSRLAPDQMYLWML